MLNELVVRTIWKLAGPLRVLVVRDASYQNHSDGTSQRGLVVVSVKRGSHRKQVVAAL